MAFRRSYPAELELVELLKRRGFYAVRVPVSGGRGFPCDVLAAKGEDRRAYEVKVTKKKTLYPCEGDSQGAGGVLPKFRLPSLHSRKMETYKEETLGFQANK